MKMRKAVGAAAIILGAARSVQATNWIWTNVAGDGSWSSSKSPGNWINFGNGSLRGAPGTTANVVFTDDVLDNLSSYTFAGITPTSSGAIVLPSLITLPNSVTTGSLSFGDVETGAGGAGGLQLSSTFTVGTNASTITLSGGTGLARVAATGSLSASAGTQMIGANFVVNSTLSSQIWALFGTGEVDITGDIITSSSQGVVKSKSGQLEIYANNSATYAGTFTAQGGTTVLDNAYAVGAGSLPVYLGGTPATGQNAGSLLNNSVTFTRPVVTAVGATTPTMTLGGNAGTNAWQGAVTINTGVLDQGLQLTAGSSTTALTTFSGLIQDGTFVRHAVRALEFSAAHWRGAARCRIALW
jgi:hypothetical protein